MRELGLGWGSLAEILAVETEYKCEHFGGWGKVGPSNHKGPFEIHAIWGGGDEGWPSREAKPPLGASQHEIWGFLCLSLSAKQSHMPPDVRGPSAGRAVRLVVKCSWEHRSLLGLPSVF